MTSQNHWVTYLFLLIFITYLLLTYFLNFLYSSIFDLIYSFYKILVFHSVRWTIGCTKRTIELVRF